MSVELTAFRWLRWVALVAEIKLLDCDTTCTMAELVNHD